MLSQSVKESVPLSLDVVHQWDDAALGMLYRNFYKALVAFSWQMVEEQTVAEELVQDAFVKIWQQRNTYKSVGALRAWLYNTVRNASISYLRHQQVERNRIQALEREFLLMRDDPDDSLLSREEAFRQLLMAVEELPAKQRQFFLLSIEGKTSREIAEEMGITIEGVKKQRQRGLAHLRQSLKPDAFLLLLLVVRV